MSSVVKLLDHHSMRWARLPTPILVVTLSVWCQMGRIIHDTAKILMLLKNCWVWNFLPEKDSECTVWRDTANLSHFWKGSSTDSKTPHILWKSQFFHLYISNFTDAFQLILGADPSEKITVENILNIWTSNDERH